MTQPCSIAAADTHDTEALRRLGVQTGHWLRAQRPVSGMPQRVYARELHELQRRHGTVLTDRLRWPLSCAAEVEVDALHVHEDHELRIVVAGRTRYVIADAGMPRLLDLGPGDWILVPAGLPHRLLPSPGERLDLLRLFSRPGGWTPRRVDAALECTAVP